MNYAISDIHGCYDLYIRLLDKIQFSESDKLHVLGDSMDRGAKSIEVMLDIMSRENIIYIMGNYEYMALRLFTKLIDFKEYNIFKALRVDGFKDYVWWLENGGDVTLKQYLSLDVETRTKIVNYLQNSSKFEVVETDNTKYILAHAGIKNISKIKSISELEKLPIESFIFERTDFSKKVLKKDFNLKLVVGHTQTRLVSGERKIYKTEDYIDIDCKAVFGGILSAYCLDTG